MPYSGPRFPPFERGGRLPQPIAVLGPTNTGKTHYAIDRMLAHQSGMIGLPLRLLAREVFDRVVARKGARSAALVTGEEKVVPPSPAYWICTVEAMPLDREVAFLAVDEIQLAADRERGRIFTSRLLHARGTAETLFLGSETMRPVLRSLFPGVRFLSRERFSALTYSGQKKVSRLPRRSAIVGFSADTVYSVAELIRRQRGGAAVILGALSPRTRNAQAELYQSGEVDYLVATDAIGMGLNMDIDHVAFASKRKFDGRGRRDLRNDELAQIAGRAGRYMRDGTFGVTADCAAFDEATISAIEEHEFEPARQLQWRSEELDFTNLSSLFSSLNRPSPRLELQRARPDEDELALERLAANEEIRDLALNSSNLALLWDVCQIPDFRKIALDQHARLLAEIYEQLARTGQIASEWLAPRVGWLDRTNGDIDAISARIAHIRTWTYLSQRVQWVEDAPYWQEKARSIEDSLSDALHEKLTQRFVDRRTSVLLKKLKDDVPLLAGVTEDGEVIVEGQFIGRLLGFEFIVDPRARGNEAKRVRAAADRALAPEFAARAAALANASPHELALREDGSISWRSASVASLQKGPAPLRPALAMRGVDALSPHLRGRILERLQTYFAARVEMLLGELIALGAVASAGDGGDLGPLARGVAYRLVENFGAMSRAQFGDELKQLDQAERAKLRKLGVRFGEYTLFMPALLKPAPAKLLTLLWALWTDRQPGAFEPPKAGLVSIAADRDLPHAYYYASGYRPSGSRAVRIDMLERLAGQIRSERKDGGEHRGGFEPSQQMMSLVGCSGEDFESILGSLGYRKHSIRIRAAESPQGGAEVAPASDPQESPAPSSAAPDSEALAFPNDGDREPPAPIEQASDPVDPAPDVSVDLPQNAVEPAAEAENANAFPVSPPAATAIAEGEGAVAAPVIDQRELIVWRLAPRRAPNKKRARPEKRAPEPRKHVDAARGEPRGESRGDPRGKPRGKPREHEAPRPRGLVSRPQMHSPQHRKVADPNSPFAVLASLKDELAKASGETAGAANKENQQ